MNPKSPLRTAMLAGPTATEKLGSTFKDAIFNTSDASIHIKDAGINIRDAGINIRDAISKGPNRSILTRAMKKPKTPFFDPHLARNSGKSQPAPSSAKSDFLL